jgi:hypothetical protein
MTGNLGRYMLRSSGDLRVFASEQTWGAGSKNHLPAVESLGIPAYAARFDAA